MYARYSEDDELRMYDDNYRRDHRMIADAREEELQAEVAVFLFKFLYFVRRKYRAR